VTNQEIPGTTNNMRWKRRTILALAASVAFSSVPLPNFVIFWPYESPHARKQLCRQMAKTMQIAMPLSTSPVALEMRLWEPRKQLCGEWRSYVGTQ
jgi:hypothetical protein